MSLSRDQIIQTAIALADARGIEAVSMRSIADKLGVRAMSLYHYVKNKAELLDGSGKVVVSSMPVVKASAKSYKLRLTCKTTKADIDSGKAAIEKVLVTTDDGKVHTIMVNKKLKDIAKPGGNPGQPGNPGNPGNPGDSRGSSGGGCDAGVSGLALAFGAALLLKRKA